MKTEALEFFPRMKACAALCSYVVNGARGMPPFADTPSLNTRIPFEGYPVMFDPVYERKTIFHNEGFVDKFIGHKRVKLVWVKRPTTQHDNQNA